MKRKTSTKRALLVSGTSVVLSAAMLMGTTMAWFTDSVTNTGNTIQAGDLKVGFGYRALTETGDAAYGSVPEQSAATGDLFTSQNWEPGRSQGVDLKVTNNGSLALKWELSFQNVKNTDNNDDGKTVNIADVLDVYVTKADAKDLTGVAPVGTLAELADGQVKTGTLNTTDASEEFSVVLKMQEGAGNEYQNCDVSFDVVLNATQTPYEKDGFDNDKYDEGAYFVPASLADMAADLDVISGYGTGNSHKGNAMIGQGGDWFADYIDDVKIDYVTGFKNGQFVVRVKPYDIAAEDATYPKLGYVMTNIRGENTADEDIVKAKVELNGVNSGHPEVSNAFVQNGDWYEFTTPTYGMGDTLGYTISVGYEQQGGYKGEAYIKAGTGWTWDAYVQVPNEGNTTNTLNPGKDAATNGTALTTAIANASAGDTILLGAGTYDLSACLDLTKDIALIGVPGETTINTTASNSGRHIEIEDGCTSVTFQNITFVGAEYTGSNGSKTDVCIKQVGSGYAFNIANCTFDGYYTSVQLFHTAGGSITGCTFNSDKVDISLSDVTGPVTISGNTYTAGQSENIGVVTADQDNITISDTSATVVWY